MPARLMTTCRPRSPGPLRLAKATGQPACRGLWPYWDVVNRWTEGWSWLDGLLARGSRSTTRVRAELLTAALALNAGPGALPAGGILRGARACRLAAAGDEHGQALVLIQLGWIQFTLGQYQEASRAINWH